MVHPTPGCPVPGEYLAGYKISPMRRGPSVFVRAGRVSSNAVGMVGRRDSD